MRRHTCGACALCNARHHDRVMRLTVTGRSKSGVPLCAGGVLGSQKWACGFPWGSWRGKEGWTMVRFMAELILFLFS